MKDITSTAKILRAAFAILILSATIPAKSQEVMWAKQLGSEGEEYSMNHVTGSHGEIYVTGKTTGSIGGTNKGANDGFIIKLDISGNTIWSGQFGTSGDEDIIWTAIDKNDNIYMTGSTSGDLSGKNAGKEDIIVVKYDSKGRIVWQKQFGTDSSDVARGICTDKKGNLFVTGVTNGKLGQATAGKADCFVMKFDSDGRLLKTFQFGSPADDWGYAIATGNNSDVFVCGTTFGEIGGKSKGMLDGFVTHLSGDLSLISSHQIGTDGFDITMILHPDNENNIYVGGSTSGNFGGNQAGEGDCFFLKMNEKGDILWNNQFGTDHHDGVRGIDLCSDKTGNVLISGIQNLPPEKGFIRMYSKDGKMIWEKTFQTPEGGGASGKDVVSEDNGIITHVGLTGFNLFGKLIGGHDVYVVRMKGK